MIGLSFTSPANAGKFNANPLVTDNEDAGNFMQALATAGITKAKSVKKWLNNWKKYWNNQARQASKSANKADKEADHAKKAQDHAEAKQEFDADRAMNQQRFAQQKAKFAKAQQKKQRQANAKKSAQSASQADKQGDFATKQNRINAKNSQVSKNIEAREDRVEKKQDAIDAKESEKSQLSAQKQQSQNERIQEKEAQEQARGDLAAEKKRLQENKEAVKDAKTEDHVADALANQQRKVVANQNKMRRQKQMLRMKFAKQLRKDAGYPGVLSYTGCVPDHSLVSFAPDNAADSTYYNDVGIVTSAGKISVAAPDVYNNECQGLWYVLVRTKEHMATLPSAESPYAVNPVVKKGQVQWYRITSGNSVWGQSTAEIPVTFASKKDPSLFAYYYCCQGQDEIGDWFSAQTLASESEDCYPVDSSFTQWTQDQDVYDKFPDALTEDPGKEDVYGVMTVIPADYQLVGGAYFIVKGNPFESVTNLSAKVEFPDTGPKDCTVENLNNDTWKVMFPAGTKDIATVSFDVLARITGAPNGGDYVSWFWCEGD